MPHHISIQTPYLVQRGKINNPLGPSTASFSNAVNLDYMGSAEFEYGALPKSLRALQSYAPKIKISVDDRILDGDRSIRVLHTYSPEDYEKYFAYLLRMREDKIRMKEQSRFDVSSTSRKDPSNNFWWDIGNHVMWSFDKIFMKRLPDYLSSSWKYMDR